MRGFIILASGSRGGFTWNGFAVQNILPDTLYMYAKCMFCTS